MPISKHKKKGLSASEWFKKRNKTKSILKKIEKEQRRKEIKAKYEEFKKIQKEARDKAKKNKKFVFGSRQKRA